MRNFSDRILLRMRQLGLTQEDLAKRVGISQTAIHKLVTGKTRRTRYLLPLAEALECRPQWLLSGHGDIRVYPPPPEGSFPCLDPPPHPDSSELPTPTPPALSNLSATGTTAPPPLADLLDSLSARLNAADPAVRDEIMRLVLRYMDTSSSGPRIVRAIEELLGQDALDDSAS